MEIKNVAVKNNVDNLEDAIQMEDADDIQNILKNLKAILRTVKLDKESNTVCNNSVECAEKWLDGHNKREKAYLEFFEKVRNVKMQIISYP